LNQKRTVIYTPLLVLWVPTTFLLWVLVVVLIHRFTVCRVIELEERQKVRIELCEQYFAAFGYSRSRLLSQRLWAYNLWSITIKVCTTYSVYWTGDTLLSLWTNCGPFSEAPCKQRALIVIINNVIFFEGFLFIVIRCPNALLEHLCPNI
jgi:hypothetical protein